ncbi:pimeloyl-ACP methyl ester carboxylesterase [Rhizobium tibeticum]|uniref:Haloacetate dehalogenase H-1 n=1 Tax=Rhizobium tibeticum TaxID=501024 RepID=A0A1H8SJ70_9HYPH|nr:alpha/beta hydrolase [Rhizobium tibeticum]MDP9813475.1 pimeloyl-ACP methyl ester carboxylesterase [Rhizobium tibeticum]SEI13210.1 Haloacetate dehalogenase H-1 [Rhizobium tibeticum]SEO78328.1 Pimeloyl-ACP methyl ester carboxylesterase [Rhizobium tibeticum]
MLKRSIPLVFSVALSAPAAVEAGAAPENTRTEIGYIDVAPDISLRRMVTHSANQKGTVLFLHGFPETLLVWKDIATELAKDYEVHAIDWPGYGLSSRPEPIKFSYSPRDYADVLAAYIKAARIDRSKLTIYATDIGSLPALLAAIAEPDIAETIVVGDFAPFNRPEYMYESLQNLKSEPAASKTRMHMNETSAEILANTYRRGLPREKQFDLPAEVLKDMTKGWGHGGITSADAFYHYYLHFTRDQDYLEAHLAELKTPVKVVWGENDLYIKKAMGEEFSRRTGAPLNVLPGIGHYPHLQTPQDTVAEIRAAN